MTDERDKIKLAFEKSKTKLFFMDLNGDVKDPDEVFDILFGEDIEKKRKYAVD